MPSRFSEPSTAGRMLSMAAVGNQAELRGRHGLVTATLQSSADQLLVDEGTVDLSTRPAIELLGTLSSAR